MKCKSWIWLGALASMAFSCVAMAQEIENRDIVENDENLAEDEMMVPAAVWMPEDDPADALNAAENEDFQAPAVVITDSNELYGVSELDLAEENTENTEVAKLPNPVYRIGTIFLTGNRENSRESILKMLHFSDEMTMDQIEEARVRLAMSNLFNSVDMAIAPGNERGTLDISIHVVERSHFQVNRYFLGSSSKSPFWMGLDVTWMAPFSTDHRFRMAYGATSSDDFTLSLNYIVPTIADLPLSLMFSVQALRSHEEVFGPSYFRSDYAVVPNAENQLEPYDNLGNLVFQRHGASFGIGWSPVKNLRLMGKVEYMRLQRDTTEPQIDELLNSAMFSGNGNMLSGEVSVSYDTREGWQLPDSGHFVMFGIKGTAETAASDYSFVRFQIAHQSNFKVAPQHIIRINSFGGAILGDAPMFEKFFFNDFYSLAPNRFQMLNPSSRGAFDLFNTGTSGLSYEDFLVHLALSYAWQPLARRIEVFATVGAVWADSRETQPVVVGVRPDRSRGVFPIDLSCNIGVRFKTDYGLFSVTLSNFLDLLVR